MIRGWFADRIDHLVRVWQVAMSDKRRERNLRVRRSVLASHVRHCDPAGTGAYTAPSDKSAHR